MREEEETIEPDVKLLSLGTRLKEHSRTLELGKNGAYSDIYMITTPGVLSQYPTCQIQFW